MNSEVKDQRNEQKISLGGAPTTLYFSNGNFIRYTLNSNKIKSELVSSPLQSYYKYIYVVDFDISFYSTSALIKQSNTHKEFSFITATDGYSYTSTGDFNIEVKGNVLFINTASHQYTRNIYLVGAVSRIFDSGGVQINNDDYYNQFSIAAIPSGDIAQVWKNQGKILSNNNYITTSFSFYRVIKGKFTYIAKMTSFSADGIKIDDNLINLEYELPKTYFYGQSPGYSDEFLATQLATVANTVSQYAGITAFAVDQYKTKFVGQFLGYNGIIYQKGCEDVHTFNPSKSNLVTQKLIKPDLLVNGVYANYVTGIYDSQVSSNRIDTICNILPLPTISPSKTPTIQPSFRPSVHPTAIQTVVPSCSPTFVPSIESTVIPTPAPSATPSVEPTPIPTPAPSVVPSVEPTDIPASASSVVPSVEPTDIPASAPSVVPSVEPTAIPTSAPSATPSVRPSIHPTPAPTVIPSADPSASPTALPSAEPSIVSTSPSIMPTLVQTMSPTQPGHPLVSAQIIVLNNIKAKEASKGDYIKLELAADNNNYFTIFENGLYEGKFININHTFICKESFKLRALEGDSSDNKIVDSFKLINSAEETCLINNDLKKIISLKGQGAEYLINYELTLKNQPTETDIECNKPSIQENKTEIRSDICKKGLLLKLPVNKDTNSDGKEDWICEYINGTIEICYSDGGTELYCMPLMVGEVGQ